VISSPWGAGWIFHKYSVQRKKSLGYEGQLSFGQATNNETDGKMSGGVEIDIHLCPRIGQLTDMSLSKSSKRTFAKPNGGDGAATEGQYGCKNPPAFSGVWLRPTVFTEEGNRHYTAYLPNSYKSWPKIELNNRTTHPREPTQEIMGGKGGKPVK